MLLVLLHMLSDGSTDASFSSLPPYTKVPPGDIANRLMSNNIQITVILQVIDAYLNFL